MTLGFDKLRRIRGGDGVCEVPAQDKGEGQPREVDGFDSLAELRWICDRRGIMRPTTFGGNWILNFGKSHIIPGWSCRRSSRPDQASLGRSRFSQEGG